jgi:GNAT superfamily N-acetyltransferase
MLYLAEDGSRRLLMAINYRPACYNDFPPAMEVVTQGVNDLLVRHGFERLAGVVTPEFHAFSLKDDPDGLWIAEDAGRVVGLGFSWVCGKFWFLADLFILPEYQGQGVGGELLGRTLEHAKMNDAENRALITFAYNRTSIGLYVKHGLFPREPLYTVAAARAVLAARVAEEFPWVALDGSRSQAAALSRIDEACLGFSREKHHRYLLSDGTVSGVLFEDDGDPVGYAYISSEGHIGPLAVATRSAVGPAFRTALALAVNCGAKEVSAFLPGANEPGMSVALTQGMRLGRTMVLLSAKAFGDWTKYAPNHPGFM